MDLNGYELSRNWFNYCFENPEKIKPVHTAIYFFAIEHCNRLGWKEKFGFPSQMVMEAIGVKNWRTYSKALNEIVDFGFLEMLEISKNQYSSNIIAIVKNTKAHTKALDKALQKHGTKQGQSIVSINKQYNKEQSTVNDIDVDLSSSENNFKIKQLYDRFVSEVKDGAYAIAIEQIYMKLKIKKGSLTPLLKSFQGQLLIDGKLHKNTGEFLKHFHNWLNTQDRVGKLNEYKHMAVGSL